ncbi:MAG: hypothetical protein ABIJ59_06175 [Pseudomonadota bacterium]
MPDFNKPFLIFLILFAMTAISIGIIPTVLAYEGIENYYIRYDVHSSKNKITADNLIMIPAKNDFRAEKFSQQPITGILSAAPGESKSLIDKQIKEDALKTVLVEYGLKSLTSKDLDTIISYEGAIITPINIIKRTYSQEENTYAYTVQVEFSPIAFPNEWETLGMKYKIKAIVYDFFQLFK